MSVEPFPDRGLDALRARYLARRDVAADSPIDVTAIDADTGEEITGSLLPRIFTPPNVTGPPGPCACACALTRETSYGFDLIEFADEIGWPLDPWQQWAAIHMGELLPDGRPRFRMVLILVARQNGKTVLCRVLTLYWMIIERAALIIGTNTSRETAKASWLDVIDFALNATPEHFPGARLAVRKTLGEESFVTRGCSRHCRQDHDHLPISTYQFAAPNRRAGRSKTVSRAVLDELREHQDWETYKALIKAMTAVADAQAVAITNQGDALAVVLDSMRTSALEFIESGSGDPRLFLAEWSAPTGSDPTDPRAIAQANPDLGNRIKLDSIMGEALRAKAAGGEELAGFKTETLCMRVALLDPAIDPDNWTACGVDPADGVDLADHRRETALCLDVALDGTHATLVAAVVLDGVTHLEVVAAWSGEGWSRRLRDELPALTERIRPRMFGWFPNGPAAVVTTDLRKRRGNRAWPPRGTKLQEITGEVHTVCMGFANRVDDRLVRHLRDRLLTAHADRTQKLTRGEVWTFTRSGVEPVDALYAAAGADYLARTMPPPLRPVTVG
jgi:phage terminase large subunit-like protein